MRRLKFLPTAAKDLNGIYLYVARQSGSKAVGRRLIGQLRNRCREIAALPGTMGRPRPDLHADIRSLAVGNYILFFRYNGRVLEVANIIEGHRDLEALFRH